MAIVVSKWHPNEEDIDIGINVDYQKELDNLILYVTDNWSFTNKENAINACVKAFNYGRYMGRNTSGSSMHPYNDLINKYKKAQNISYEQAWEDSCIGLLDDLSSTIRSAHEEATIEWSGVHSPNEELLTVLQANPDTAFKARPKGFDEFCKRYCADELSDDEIVYDERESLKSYSGVVFRGDRNFNITSDLDIYQNARGLYDQSRSTEETLIKAAMNHGVDLQIMHNSAHVDKFLADFDPTKVHSEQSLYESASNELKNHFNFCLSHQSKRTRFSDDGMFLNHRYDISPQTPDVKEIKEIQRLIDSSGPLNEQRKWLGCFDLNFKSDGKDPLMSYCNEGDIVVDSRDCMGPMDAKLKVVQAYFDAGKLADKPKEMPKLQTKEYRLERKKDLAIRAEESFDPLADEVITSEEPELNRKHGFLLEVGFKHVKDDRYVHPEFKCKLQMDKYVSYQDTETIFHSIYNAGFELTNTLDKDDSNLSR